MAFAGALGSPVMIFIAPVLLHTKLLGWRKRQPLSHILSIACILLGTVGCILGLKGAIQEML
ncbi:hypothetical protein DSO57_1032421 [Entomophthora muscae]|uniref:Uncharacterized protein n=1 Tax=Entomophthora muscae TaxID=34485 RepID=A0ACC2SPN5_9FUNG|nr:hypothetical protein DSO57_1032421 [Entomophthora muscae]